MVQVKTDTELTTVEEAYVWATSIGDIASGAVTVSYNTTMGSTVVFEVPYDTKVGPDGLTIVLDAYPGDTVHGEADSVKQRLTLTEEVYEHASRTLSQYRADLVRQSGGHGISDGWTPDA